MIISAVVIAYARLGDKPERVGARPS